MALYLWSSIEHGTSSSAQSHATAHRDLPVIRSESDSHNGENVAKLFGTPQTHADIIEFLFPHYFCMFEHVYMCLFNTRMQSVDQCDIVADLYVESDPAANMQFESRGIRLTCLVCLLHLRDMDAIYLWGLLAVYVVNIPL